MCHKTFAAQIAFESLTWMMEQSSWYFQKRLKST